MEILDLRALKKVSGGQGSEPPVAICPKCGQPMDYRGIWYKDVGRQHVWVCDPCGTCAFEDL